MKERPILFSGPMVRAILEGRKTMTRRGDKRFRFEPHQELLYLDYCENASVAWPYKYQTYKHTGLFSEHCRYGVVGDRLWCRETWKPFCAGPISDEFPLGTCVKYAADGALMKPTTWSDEQGMWCEAHEEDNRWRPSIFMPRWASRITLEITGVRVERLNEITYDDAVSEGLVYEAGVWSVDDKNGQIISRCVDPRDTFMQLWSSINGRESWNANPWVWVVEFRRIKP